jgi:hypothetical protein
MTTYQDIQTRIATDYLNRTDLTPQIQNAIQATIRVHQRQRFWFLETATALVAVVANETIPLPSNFLFMQELQVTQNSANIMLVPSPFQQIRWLNINNTLGLPTRYALYGSNIHFANIPDSAYPVPCYYIKQLPELSAGTDTNDWLSAAEDLVVYGATKLVYSTVIRNMSAGAVFAGLENQLLLELQREGGQHQSLSLRPTRF